MNLIAVSDHTTLTMYRNTYQSGFLSILYAVGAKPLEQWATHVESGFIKRITDPDI